jgi:hypothetical protein
MSIKEREETYAHGLKVFLEHVSVRRVLVRQLMQLKEKIIAGVLKLRQCLFKKDKLGLQRLQLGLQCKPYAPLGDDPR